MLGDPNASRRRLTMLTKLMQDETVDGQRAIDDPALRDRLMQLQGRVLAMQFTGMRNVTAAAKKESPGLAGLIVKLQGCELNHQLSTLAIDALGELGVLYDDSPHLRAQRQLAVVVDVRPRPDHRRRHGADPEEHHRRARPRHAARAESRERLSMEFALSEQQKMMQDSIDAALAKACPLDRVRKAADGGEAVADDVWRSWPSSALPACSFPRSTAGWGSACSKRR